jgi:hypothetical protein
MRKKAKPEPSIRAEATAKAELSAKLVRERKHTIKEVVPSDVTRAKAGAWLDILSPITEWAGLKGDALRYRRQQLRIQQDAALDRLAKIVRKKMQDRQLAAPLTPKILVPALEAASLEAPDSPLIAWWANLLVSGASGGEIRPYLLNLMTAIGAEEAAVLAQIWQGFSSNKEYRSGEYNLPLRGSFNLKRSFDAEVRKLEGRTFSEDKFMDIFLKIFRKLVDRSERSGIPAEFALVQRSNPDYNGHRLSFRHCSSLTSELVPVQVCLALKLLEEHKEKFEPKVDGYGIIVPATLEKYVELKIIVPSNLGLEFLSVCQPPPPSRR